MLSKLGHYLEETEFFIYSTTGLTGLKTLDLFGARITDHGMAYLKRESSRLLQDLGFINSLLFAAAPQSAQLLDDLCLIFLCTWNVADFKNLQTLELCVVGVLVVPRSCGFRGLSGVCLRVPGSEGELVGICLLWVGVRGSAGSWVRVR